MTPVRASALSRTSSPTGPARRPGPGPTPCPALPAMTRSSSPVGEAGGGLVMTALYCAGCVVRTQCRAVRAGGGRARRRLGRAFREPPRHPGAGTRRSRPAASVARRRPPMRPRPRCPKRCWPPPVGSGCAATKASWPGSPRRQVGIAVAGAHFSGENPDRGAWAARVRMARPRG